MPIRFDQLLEFVPPFRPPVYSTPHARVADETSTVVGEIDMSLTQWLSGDGVTEVQASPDYKTVGWDGRVLGGIRYQESSPRDNA